MDSLPEKLRMRLAVLSEQLRKARAMLERRRSKVEAMERELVNLQEAAATFKLHFPELLPEELPSPAIRPESPSTNGSVIIAPDSPMMDLVGKSIRQCAEKILAEQGGTGLHYSQIAKTAIERGYRSPKNKDTEAIIRSFWDTLRRATSKRSSEGGSLNIVFLGRGTFRWTVRNDAKQNQEQEDD